MAKARVSSKHSHVQKTFKHFGDHEHISAFGRNSDSDMWTFQNCDMETFETQTGDITNTPNRASLVNDKLPKFSRISKNYSLKPTL